MVKADAMMSSRSLKEIAESVAQSLSYARIRGHSAYVATALLYANGTGVLVRIDEDGQGFTVSDDGHGAHIAETMGGLPAYNRIAATVADRMGVSFMDGAFRLHSIDRDRLPGAVTAIANASARANDRVAQAHEALKARKSRDLFDQRLRAAFGDAIAFDVTEIGARGRVWDYDAAVELGDQRRLFAFVVPAFAAVAAANIKINDTLAQPEPPQVTAVLADYNRTDPSLRAILSDAGSIVIAASDDVERYRLIASDI